MLIAAIIAIFMSGLSLGVTVYKIITEHKTNIEDRRQKFFQQLINGFFIHNWKFIEYWENKGIRPQLDTTIYMEDKPEEFGHRVVLLDHLNILWQISLHRTVISKEDMDSFKNWAKSWFEYSKEQMHTIFENGDLYPLDYITWLRDEVFGKEKFNPLIGKELAKRIEEYEGKKKS